MNRNFVTKALSILLITFLLTANANANDSEKQKIIVDIIKSTNLVDAMAQIDVTMRRQIVKELKNQNPNASPKALAVVTELVGELLKPMYADALQFSAHLWFKLYSTEELKTIQAFYQTPAGKKTIRLLPQMTQQTLAWSQQWVRQKFVPNFDAEMQKHLKERGLTL